MPAKTETLCCTPRILEGYSSVISWRSPHAISCVAVGQSMKYGTIVHQKQHVEVFVVCAACNLHPNCFSVTILWVLAAVTYMMVRRHVSVSERCSRVLILCENFIPSVYRATALSLIYIVLQQSKAHVLACAEVVLPVVYREPLWVQGKPRVGGPLLWISSEYQAALGTSIMSSLPLL